VHAATQETVTLVAKIDVECRFLRVLPGTFPISLRMTEGFVAPMFGTAVGTAILTQMTDDEVSSLLARANLRTRKRSERFDPNRILREVREARLRGFAIAYDAVFPDTGALAVPFSSDIPTYPMAVGVGGLGERIRRSEQHIFKVIRASIARHTRRSTR
jgi:DNA-binding IclR family transcriptional regulator